jgi:hypothetical protein
MAPTRLRAGQVAVWCFVALRQVPAGTPCFATRTVGEPTERAQYNRAAGSDGAYHHNGVDGDMKRPIDKVRDSGGSFEFNTPDDSTEIAGVLTFADRMLVVKGKGIYEYKSADTIDPERTNINVRSAAQRVLPVGADTPWVGAVVLTAHRLFAKSHLIKRVDCDKALTLVFAAAQHIARMHVVRDEYVKAQSQAAHDFDGKRRSVILPTVDNVEARCKEFLQKADHVLQEMLELVTLFYGDAKGAWTGLQARIASEQESQTDQFGEFLKDYVPFLVTVRNARNSAEHPTDKQYLKAEDFSVDATNTLHPPVIEVKHPKTPVPRMPIEHFMNQITEGIVTAVELLMVFMCARHVRNDAPGFRIRMMVLPEERRQSGVRYCYGTMIGGELVPLS